MPPPLAACLFAGFIIWLFRRYSKEAGPMPFALWIPFIWVGINLSRPLAYWFVSGTTAAAANTVDISEGSFVDRNMYLFLIIAGILVLLRRRINWNSIVHHGRWLWIFYFYLLLSVLWSDYTFVSFKRWFKDAGDLIMILIILTEKDPVEAIRGIFIRCAYLLIPLSVLFIKYYPTIGRYENRWTYTQSASGVTLSKNALGELSMLSALFLLWQMVDIYRLRDVRLSFRKLWPDLLVLAMCLWMLWIANSATALYSFVLGAAVFFGTRLRWIRANLGNLGWCLAGVALIMLVFTISPGFRGAIAGFLHRDVTLTERTVIWQNALNLGTNPLIGAGFSSVWLAYHAVPFVKENHLAHSHNGYLETYLNTGWIGVCLLLSVLTSAGKNATRHLLQRSSVGYLFIAFFLAALFYNYTEVTFNFGNVIGLFLWLLSAGGMIGVMHASEVRVDVSESARASYAETSG